jgi:hypothetical protein
MFQTLRRRERVSLHDEWVLAITRIFAEHSGDAKKDPGFFASL